MHADIDTHTHARAKKGNNLTYSLVLLGPNTHQPTLQRKSDLFDRYIYIRIFFVVFCLHSVDVHSYALVDNWLCTMQHYRYRLNESTIWKRGANITFSVLVYYWLYIVLDSNAAAAALSIHLFTWLNVGFPHLLAFTLNILWQLYWFWPMVMGEYCNR